MTRILVPACVLGACLLWLTPPWTINHDAAWFLQMAARWLDGARLYRDVVDVNPPLAVYLSSVPVALARTLGAPVTAVFAACVLAWCWGCAAITARVLRIGRVCDDAGARRILVAAVLSVTTVLPGADFGQREHLLLAGLIAYAATCGARGTAGSVPRGLSITAGALAGVGLALKPFFLAAPLCVAAHAAITRGPRAVATPEHGAIAAVIAGYAMHLALLPDDVAQGLRATVHLAWQTYGAYDATAGALLGDPLVIECAVLATALLAAPRAGTALPLGLCQVALLGAGLLQHKGWSYHFLPAFGLGWLLVATIALRVAALRAAAGAALLFVLVITVVERDPAGGLRIGKPGREEIAAGAALRALAPGPRVVALDTGMHPWHVRALHAGLEWGMRLPCLWPLPGGDAAARAALRGDLREDWQAHPPHLVIVPTGPLEHVDDPAFDVLAWLLEDPALAAVWARYELAAETDAARTFRLRE